MGENGRGNSGNPALHFGRQVRKQRTSHGWSIHEMAKRSGISVGHVSRLENGLRPPTEHIAELVDAVFPERKGWFGEFYSDSQAWTPPGTRHWFEYEAAARQIWAWASGQVHGLTQCPSYAQAQLETLPGATSGQVDARLKARMARQERILRGEDPPQVWILVDELALWRVMGSAEVMAEQMDYLLDVARLDHVTVQVVPAVGHAAVGSELEVTEKAAFTEHLAGGYVYTEQEPVTEFQRLVVRLTSESYRASETVAMIGRVRGIWESGESPATAMLKAARASK